MVMAIVQPECRRLRRVRGARATRPRYFVSRALDCEFHCGARAAARKMTSATAMAVVVQWHTRRR
jgi:hypothetical protein